MGVAGLQRGVLATDLGSADRPPAPVRPRLRNLYRFWPLVALAVESVVGWFAIRLDLWANTSIGLPEPILIMIAVGAVLAVLPRFFRSRRAQTAEQLSTGTARKPRASATTLGLVAVLVVFSYFFGLSLKMSLNNTSAMRVVNELEPQAQDASGLCWTTPAYLQAVSSMISASKVCAAGAQTQYGIGQQVWWVSSSSNVMLMYSATPLVGSGAGVPSLDDACVQNIDGPWWFVAGTSDIYGCPLGFTGTGSG
jgi:hypothetical protein